MKCKKRYITLLEIMIVIFLIGIIGSVIGYNMKGSIDKGKVFRTQESIKQVHDILLLEIAEGASIDKVIETPLKYLKKSGIVKDPKKMLEDGWGHELVFNKTKDGMDMEIESIGLKNYYSKTKTHKKTEVQEEYEE